MSQTPLYILDTNVLVMLVRAASLGQYIDRTYGISVLPSKPLVCIVSVGEALKLARQFNWGDPKTARLWELLHTLVWVDISRRQVLDAYAEIAHWADVNGKRKPQNDYWIAATAKAAGATLLTTDKDFDVFDGTHIQRVWIDEAIVKGK